MNPTIVSSFLLHLLISFSYFPTPSLGVKMFDREHVISYRHGHNAGAPAQMRIMKPSIINLRYKKSLADRDGSEPHSMIQNAPANTPDEEHKLTKRAVAISYEEYIENRKAVLAYQKMTDGTDQRAVAQDIIGQPSPGKGKLLPNLGPVSNQQDIKNTPSLKSVKARETSAHHQAKNVKVFKTVGSLEDDFGVAAPDFPVPGFIEAPAN